MPVLEKAELHIRPESRQAFQDVVPSALPLLRQAHGCRSVELLTGVERPDVHLLLIEWDSVSAHEEFTSTPEFARFVGLIKDLLGGPTGAEHFVRADPLGSPPAASRSSE